MHSFLEILADAVLESKSEELSKLCIVFPSRRAGIYFKNFLSQKISRPVFSPAILGIQDFVSELSPYTIPDRLTLICELYECYVSIGQNESFDSFYPWGEMLLRDFDDIDKNLVNTENLFRVLIEHKEVEEQFGFTPAESEAFLKFWNTFSNRELTDEQKNFIKTWEVIGKVFGDYRKRLVNKNICYEGMAYREIYELMRANKLSLRFDKVVFAGFNQLNRAEESIMKELITQNKAEIYWDADEFYVNNELMEAGKFLRSNFTALKQEEPGLIGTGLASIEKNITITGAALQSGQAKALGYLLEQDDGASENTAVILPDESLLLPVLHSIPEHITAMNITMGYPFKNSLLHNFVKSLFSLQKNKKSKGKNTVYFHSDCSAVLSGPYLKLIDAAACFRIIDEINKKNVIYLNYSRIQSAANTKEIIFAEIFKHIDSSDEVIPYLFRILSLAASAYEEKNPAGFRFEKEFFYVLYTELTRIEGFLKNYNLILEQETLWKLLIEMLENVKIPFTGEPLKGLQVMGLLETRALDFENVYILSMNEGTVPRTGANGSYIPYHLRKAFRMPTYEDDDASFAYYFYRLLQRGKNIHLIYNNQTSGLISGEKSRFIMQIENELTKYNKKIKLKSFIFQPSVDKAAEKNITIQKSDEVVELISKMILSASSVSDYIQCSLKFYLSRIAGLKKEEPVEEAFSGASFGSLLHEIMSQLYGGSIGSEINEIEIQSFKAKLEDDYDSIWSNACRKIPELKEFADGLYGKNLLFKNVIKKLIGLILENDLSQLPFEIVDIEKKLIGELEINSNNSTYSIKLTGRLDRVEQKDGVIRIIDYKTGSFSPKRQGRKTLEDYFAKVVSDPDYRESFQQYFYAMLYQDVFSPAKLNIGIYPLRSASKGIEFYEDNCISNESFDKFKKKLTALLSEILDPSVPFTKTDKIERCKYCDFISLCYRE